MLSIKLKSKRIAALPPVYPIKPHQYSGYGYQKSPPHLPTPQSGVGMVHPLALEAHRRNRIITEMAAKCALKVGDVCRIRQVDDSSQLTSNLYGDLTVVSIASSYAEYHRDSSWPEHNYPFIVRTSYHPVTNPEQTLYLSCTPALLILKSELDANENKDNTQAS